MYLVLHSIHFRPRIDGDTMTETQKLRIRRSYLLRTMKELEFFMDDESGAIRELAWQLHYEMNKELGNVTAQLIKLGGM